MKILGESGENYLEVILELEKLNGEVRSIDIARQTQVSRASVSKAVGMLRDAGYVEASYYGHITLTEKGKDYAKKVRYRHDLLSDFLHRGLGVTEEIADQDACRMEHVVSDELIDCIKNWLN